MAVTCQACLRAVSKMSPKTRPNAAQHNAWISAHYVLGVIWGRVAEGDAHALKPDTVLEIPS